MRIIFKNKLGQLRSGWKITFVILMALFINFVLSYFIGAHSILMMFSSSRFKGLGIGEDEALQYLLQSPIRNSLLQMAIPLAFILAVYAGVRLLDSSSLKNTGLFVNRKSLTHLLIGLLFGTISISIIFYILLISGNISFTRNTSTEGSWMPVLWGLALFTLVGSSEELFSRGYLMMVLRQTDLKWIPPVVSSLIFSLLHTGNPGINILGLLNIFLIGMLLAYMVIKTGNILMAIGYHITWNFFQGNIFGLSVSGVGIDGIYKSEVIRDNLLSGGAFGPEAGLLTTAIVLLGAASLWGYGYLASRRRVRKSGAETEVAVQ